MTGITNSKLIRTLALLVAGACAALSLQAQKSLTNLDVIKMVKAGVPESAIVSSIQSSPHKFDLSPDALLGLQRAGVSQKILDVMMKSAGNGASPTEIRQSATPSGLLVRATPTSATVANPTNAGKTPKQDAAKFRPGPRVHNPRIASDGIEPETRRLLEAQRSFVLAHKSVPTLGPSSIRSGTLNPVKPSSQLNPQPLENAAPTSIVTVQPHGSGDPRAVLSSSMRSEPCVITMGPQVLSVNGSSTAAVFSPDSQFNAYVIEGCNFGNATGSVHLFGTFQNPAQMTFTVDPGGWTDNALYLHLNPNITGEVDNNNVTLVIQRGDGVSSHIAGFNFYAARDWQNPLALTYIPTAVAKLDAALPLNGGLLYESPYAPNAAHIMRDSGTAFSKGHDYFDFTKLAAGFVLYDVQPQYFDAVAACPIEPTTNPKWDIYTTGSWQLQWNNQGVGVDWPVTYCHYKHFSTNPDFTDYKSGYSLAVWVVGPRGVTTPWPNGLH